MQVVDPVGLPHGHSVVDWPQLPFVLRLPWLRTLTAPSLIRDSIPTTPSRQVVAEESHLPGASCVAPAEIGTRPGGTRLRGS
jgi:hypothetical protein